MENEIKRQRRALARALGASRTVSRQHAERGHDDEWDPDDIWGAIHIARRRLEALHQRLANVQGEGRDMRPTRAEIRAALDEHREALRGTGEPVAVRFRLGLDQAGFAAELAHIPLAALPGTLGDVLYLDNTRVSGWERGRNLPCRLARMAIAHLDHCSRKDDRQ